MTLTRPLINWLMLFSLVVTWGSTFALNKIALVSLPPLVVVSLRLVIGAVVLLVICWRQQRSLWLPLAQWKFLAVLAVTGFSLPFFLIVWGQQNVDSALAGILMAVIPLLTMLLSHFLFETERITRNRLAGFCFGFIGIILLVGTEALHGIGGSALIPQLAVLGGAVCYAVNVAITPYNRVTSVLVTSSATLLIASFILVPVSLVLHPVESWSWRADSMIAVAVLGIFGTAFPTLIFYRLVASAGPTFYSLINYMIPLWAVIIGALFLQERPDWSAYAALALILGGIGISQLKRQSAKTE